MKTKVNSKLPVEQKIKQFSKDFKSGNNLLRKNLYDALHNPEVIKYIKASEGFIDVERNRQLYSIDFRWEDGVRITIPSNSIRFTADIDITKYKDIHNGQKRHNIIETMNINLIEQGYVNYKKKYRYRFLLGQRTDPNLLEFWKTMPLKASELTKTVWEKYLEGELFGEYQEDFKKNVQHSRYNDKRSVLKGMVGTKNASKNKLYSLLKGKLPNDVLVNCGIIEKPFEKVPS